MTHPAFDLSEGFSLGVINVYPTRNLISTGGGEVHLEPKVMDVLCLLAENSGNVVSRSYLIDQIWEVEFGSDESLTRAISLLRKALQNGEKTGGIIETIPKKGYLLTLPVYGMQDASLAGPTSLSGNGTLNPAPAAKRLLKLNPRYLALAVFALIAAVSIAILYIWYQPVEPEIPLTAFFGITADPDNETAGEIAQQATEEIFSGLDGMGLRTVTRGQTQGVPSKQQLFRAKELGARFSLGGRIRRDETGYIISVQIADVQDQKTLWEAVVKGLEEDRIYLPVQAADRALRALDCFNRMPLQSSALEETKAAVSDLCTEVAKVRSSQFIPLARAAAARLPENPDIHAILAFNLWNSSSLSGSPERDEIRKEAIAAAAHALDIDPDNGAAQVVMAFSAFSIGGSLAELETQLAAAANVVPRSTFANLAYSKHLQLVGQPDLALRYSEAAAQLTPTNVSIRVQYGRNLFFAGSSLEAVRWLEEQHRRDPTGSAWSVLTLLAYYGDAGDLDNALSLKTFGTSEDYVSCVESLVTAETNLLAIEVTEQCIENNIFYGPRRVLTGGVTGELDYAYAAAQKHLTPINLFEFRNNQTIAWLYTSKYRAMRADRRFLPLMKRLGLFDYWVTSNTQPEVCDAAEDRDSELCIAIHEAQTESSSIE